MKKKVIFRLIFCLCLSLLLITICSKNSPIYCFNDWVDGNAFFTMGKGIMNGLVPYKDLFEQKGPILYLIYGIGYLISNSNFLGVYILEIISFLFFIYYMIKTISLLWNEKNSYLITILTCSILVSSCFFVQGGSAEEFCFPFIMYSFYSFIKYIKNQVYDKNILFFNGLAAGIISLIKFNLLGFWFIWMALIFFKIILEKKYKEAFISCIVFLLGMLSPIIVVSIYFIINGAFTDFIEAYVTFNFGAYTTELSIVERIKNFIISFKGQFLQSKLIFHLISFGFIGAIFTNKIFENIYNKLFIILSFFFLGLGIYIGGLPYNYYFLLNEVYILFGILFIFKVIESKYQKHPQITYIVLLLIVLLFSAYKVKNSQNLNDRHLNKDYYAQYTFNEIIKTVDNPTVLNYDNLDGGFYTVSNIIPNTKYFMRQNISYERYPQILDGQNKIIKDKGVDFVIVREYFDNIDYHLIIPNLNDNYDLLKKQTQLYEGMEFTYFLYQKKG